MNRNQIEGRFKDVAGRVQQLAGELSGNARLQAKGVATQVEGKVQWGVGEVEGAVLRRSTQRRALEVR
jgi:uncharacterized protein YjbJ (UPF0337 family)